MCVHIFISYIETRFKQAIYPRLIFPSESVESLYDFTTTSDKLMIGACVPLSQIQHKCEEFANDSKLTRTVMPIHDMLRWFASTQIRNVGKFFSSIQIHSLSLMFGYMTFTSSHSPHNFEFSCQPKHVWEEISSRPVLSVT